MMGQTVRLSVHRRVVQAFSPSRQGECLRRPRGLRLEAGDQTVPGKRDVRSQAPGLQAPSLVRGDQGQLRQRSVRSGECRAQQMFEMRAQPGDPGLVKDVAVVFPPGGQAVVAGLHIEGQIEFGDRDRRRQKPGLDLAEGQTLQGGVLHHEHHLEQRTAGELSLRLEMIDQQLEGQVRMAVGGETAGSHAGDETVEIRDVAPGPAQGQGVDEHADQILAGPLPTVGHGAADQQVVLAAVPCQQQAEGRQQGHEVGGTGRAAVRPKPLGQGRVQVVLPQPAGIAAGGRVRAVRRQVELGRRAGQRVAPEVQLPPQGLVTQPVGLPGGVVGEIDLRHRQIRLGARLAGAVQGGEVADQQVDRPAVADDVVDVEQQPVLRRSEDQQMQTEQGPSCQIEGAGGMVMGQTSCFPLGIGAAAEMGDPERVVGGEQQGLGFAGLVREMAAQAVMALDETGCGGA